MKTGRSVGTEKRPRRTSRRVGATAILLAIGCAWAPLNAQVASEPTMPPVHLSPPSVNWRADQLAAYADAAAVVESKVERFAERYARAQRDRKKASLIAANEEAIRTAIRDAGLTLAEFDAIHRAVQGDPRLHARVQKLSMQR